MRSPELGRRGLLAGGVAAVAGTAVGAPALAAEKAATAEPERLKGYTYPLSAKGIANLAGPPPWNYVGDLLGVEFWTSPAAANATLPTGLSPDPAAPGHGYALFIDWQFSGSNEEYLDPARSRYSEFLILLDATYQGTSVAWCPFIYVDNDTSGQLTFPPAAGEEVSDLAPQRVGAGFRGTLSYSVTDLKILA